MPGSIPRNEAHHDQRRDGLACNAHVLPIRTAADAEQQARSRAVSAMLPGIGRLPLALF
jgi:hypothetical protein